MTDRPPDAPARDATEHFAEHRELLFAVVYSMLGTVADTEDVLQETWLSWEVRHRSRTAEPVEHPRAYLVRAAINAALARQREVKRRRETYIGPWLPDPVPTFDETVPDAADHALRAESVSMALMVVLESLSPAERAVFVLHEVFGYAHTEIAEMTGRSRAAVRQLAHRAREHVHARRPRNQVDPRVHRDVTERFMDAVAGGDITTLVALLAPDVTLVCDGGGKGPAAGPRPVHGAQQVAGILLNRAANRRLWGVDIEYRAVNGTPGALLLRGGEVVGLMILDLADGGGRVTGLYAVTNPTKLVNLR